MRKKIKRSVWIVYSFFHRKFCLIKTYLFWRRKNKVSVATGAQEFCWSDIEIVYINLESRIDRRRHIEAQFDLLGVSNYRRFPAVKCVRGITGCNISHRDVVTSWDPNVCSILFICEDDLVIDIGKVELERLLRRFVEDPRLDVLCIGNNTPYKLKINETFAISQHILTTSGYLVKAHVQPNLAEAFNKSVGLAYSGLPQKDCGLDVVWQEVQSSFVFAVPIVRTAYQMESFSDIEQSIVNYGS